MEEQKTKAFLANGLYVPAAWVHENPGILAQFTYMFEQQVNFGMDIEDTYTLEQEVHTYKRVGEYYVFARGDMQKVYNLFGAHFDIVDKRSNVPLPPGFKFTGTLRPNQKEGLKAFIEPNIGGIFQAAPAYGKTVVMVAYVSLLQQKTLLLVNKIDLREQFMDRVNQYTNIKEVEAQTGQPFMGELKFDKEGNPVTYPITVSTYQLIAYEPERLKKIQNMFGLVLVDECHRAPATSLTRILRDMNPALFMGVSATPRRKDGYHKLLPDLIGPVRFKSSVVNNCDIKIVKGTHFAVNSKMGWTTLISVVTKSVTRNKKIIDNILVDILEGRRLIVLTDRTKHVEDLCKMAKQAGVKADFLTGAADNERRDAVIKRVDALDQAINYLKEVSVKTEAIDWDAVLTWSDLFESTEPLKLGVEINNKVKKIYEDRIDCLVATSKLFGEGSDIPCIDTLHLVVPTANDVFMEQAIGRVQRDYPRKLTPKAVFYADTGHGILYGCAKKFKKVCETQLNYVVSTEDNNNAEDGQIL